MDLLLSNATVFDGQRFSDAPLDVVVRDDEILTIGADLVATDDVRRMDCTGQVLTPGLIDCHVHVSWAGPAELPTSIEDCIRRTERNLEQLLAAGVTTIRDVGGPLDIVSGVSSRQRAGSLLGPEVVYAGHLLCAHGGHGTEMEVAVPIAREVADGDELAAAVRDQVASGAELVKITLNSARGDVELPEDVVRAGVEQAHALGVPATCHASVPDACAVAVRAGADCLEHGNGLSAADAAVLGARGGAVVLTVSIFEELLARLTSAEHTVFGDEARQETLKAVQRRVAEHPPALAAAREHGVRIGLGTDRVPGWGVVAIVEEALAMHSLGLSIEDVLRSATHDGALIARRPDRGHMAAGARADLVLFDGDLRGSLEALAKPLSVIQAGVLRGNH